MTSDEKQTFFQYLFAIAWVDGSMDEEEAGILRNILSATELDEEARSVVVGWFDEPPPEPDWDEPREDEQLREMLMRQAILMAGADLVFNIDEMAYLERLRDRLGMEEGEFHEILQEMERHLAETSTVE